MFVMTTNPEQALVHHIQANAVPGQLVGEGFPAEEEQVAAQDQGVCG